MQFEYVELSYLTAAGDGILRRVTLLLAGLDKAHMRSLRSPDLDLEVSCEGDGVVRVSVLAHVTLRVKACALHASQGFALDDTVLLNGYQSWTDTHPRSVEECISGLNQVPKPVVDRFALDGAGDYRFVDYSGESGRFHGYTYAALTHVDGRTSRTTLIASLDESHGFTRIDVDTRRGTIEIVPECPMGAFDAETERVLCRVAVLSSDAIDSADESASSGEDVLYDRWFQLSGITARPVKPLVGYTSWYRHYDNISAQALLNDLAGARVAIEGVRDLDILPVFQIDDGFCRVGDWLDVDRGRFSDGLAPLAQAIRAAGFVPGLWLAPFVCERDSHLFADHPDWLLRDGQGNLCKTGSHWSGGYALDITVSAVRDYVSDVVKTVVNEWGFGLLKLDFLYGACMVEHAGMNRGELMKAGVDLLRAAAGDDCLLLGCGVPLAPAFGVMDYCRIGCDVGHGWNSDFVWRRLQRERVSTRNSLFNTIGRAPLDGRAFGCDPDVFYLRDGARLSKAQREMLISVDACYASALLTSDDMGEWTPYQRAWFRAAVEVLADRKGS